LFRPESEQRDEMGGWPEGIAECGTASERSCGNYCSADLRDDMWPGRRRPAFELGEAGEGIVIPARGEPKHHRLSGSAGRDGLQTEEIVSQCPIKIPPVRTQHHLVHGRVHVLPLFALAGIRGVSAKRSLGTSGDFPIPLPIFRTAPRFGLVALNARRQAAVAYAAASVRLRTPSFERIRLT
jgi:hypothetical protein